MLCKQFYDIYSFSLDALHNPLFWYTVCCLAAIQCTIQYSLQYTYIYGYIIRTHRRRVTSLWEVGNWGGLK